MKILSWLVATEERERSFACSNNLQNWPPFVASMLTEITDI
jgi:hypothetical protein